MKRDYRFLVTATEPRGVVYVMPVKAENLDEAIEKLVEDLFAEEAVPEGYFPTPRQRAQRAAEQVPMIVEYERTETRHPEDVTLEFLYTAQKYWRRRQEACHCILAEGDEAAEPDYDYCKSFSDQLDFRVKAEEVCGKSAVKV